MQMLEDSSCALKVSKLYTPSRRFICLPVYILVTVITYTFLAEQKVEHGLYLLESVGLKSEMKSCWSKC